MSEYFMKTDRIGFSHWNLEKASLAHTLWSNYHVAQYICARGTFTDEEITSRLQLEMSNQELYGFQYWPLYELETGKFMGCCGVRPYPLQENCLELGYHLLKEFWGKGIGTEAATAAKDYAFTQLNADKLFAYHHPQNDRSKHVLEKLGFTYIGTSFYEPTGLYHPTYYLNNPKQH